MCLFLLVFGCGVEQPGQVIIVDPEVHPADQLSTNLTIEEQNTIVLSEFSKDISSLSLNDGVHAVSDIKEVLKSYGVDPEYLEDDNVRTELFQFLRQLYPIFSGGLSDEDKKSMLDSAVAISANLISAATGLPPGITRSVLQLMADIAWDRYLERRIEEPMDQVDTEKAKRVRKNLDSRANAVDKDQKKEIVRSFIREFLQENGVDVEDAKDMLRAKVAELKTRKLAEMTT